MNDLRNNIQNEIDRIKGELGDQKRLIRQNVSNKLIVETAESEMKALHSRLSVLAANLAKAEIAEQPLG